MTLEPLFAEAYRLRLLRGLERLLSRSGFCGVAGVDEAGRGALAGPVVVAAVIMDPTRLVPGVDDSKALAPEVRERLYDLVRESALATSVAAASADEIDRSDVLAATKRAMTTALRCLDPAPDCAVVDAVRLSGLPFPVIPLVRGDSVSYGVACASIVAKVTRDRLMVEAHRRYPHYGFDAHKGYASAEHRRALASFGPCPIHRLTFASVLPRRPERRAS